MHRGRHPVLMRMKTGVTKDGKLTGMSLRDASRRRRLRLLRRRLAPFIRARCRRSPTKFRATASAAAARSPTSRPAGPSGDTGRRSRASARRCSSTRSQCELGLDPAELRLKHCRQAELAHGKLAEIGPSAWRNASGQVVSRSDWKNEHRKLPDQAAASASPAVPTSPAPGCRSTGTTCRTRACSSARPQRADDGVLRRDRDRARVGRCARRDGRRSARHRRPTIFAASRATPPSRRWTSAPTPAA